ncbi:MAG: transketolase [Proteobacteria bacterium]|nr:transketolase [Pseudomonadota bacterium]
MRNAFASELTEIATSDSRVVLLSGDIGNKLFDDFKMRAADRFFNCGVAEANIIGMAAGMASVGLRPIAYTITPFITYRCLEQIRVDVCYHHQPVIIVGVGSGLGYASLGATHHSCEDIAIMRTLPEMTVLCPADRAEVRGALRAAIAHSGPCYIRLGKKGEPDIHERPISFSIGESIKLRTGQDVCLLSVGTIAPVAISIANTLESRGITTSLYSFHSVKPLDTATLEGAFAAHRLVVTIEEHSRLGGAGSAVGEWLVDSGRESKKLLCIATKDAFFHDAGETGYAQKYLGIDQSDAVQAILSRILHESAI